MGYGGGWRATRLVMMSVVARKIMASWLAGRRS